LVDGKEYVVSISKTSEPIASLVAESNSFKKLRTEHKTVPDSIHETLHDRVQDSEKPKQKQETKNPKQTPLLHV